MKKIIYGVTAPPPTKATAEAFGSTVNPVPISGGQGTTYVAGDIVLKPAGDPEEEKSTADVFNVLPESDGVRFPRPIKSTEGNWIYGGYVAWTFLKGEHVKGQYDKKLAATSEYHRLLKGIKQPDFQGGPRDSWAAASDVVLESKPFDYDQEFVDLYDQIKPHLKPLPADRQLVHGDLSGNFLCHPALPPAIIDFSPTWAPSGFGEGIMLADIIAWENASEKDLEVFKQNPRIGQLAWYGVLRRIAEQPEHIKWLGKDKAVTEARSFQKTIDFLGKNFP